MTPALEVIGLTLDFRQEGRSLRVLDGVSFRVEAGRTLAIVGESGCGKSVTALAIMGLLPGTARIGGTIRLGGRDLGAMSAEQRRLLRGGEMAMIFQEPMTSLNPAFTAGDQVAEALRLHQGLDKAAAFAEAVRMLDRVRIPDASRRAKQYPHQLSGGMRQRVMIAMALACKPRLLIADEPTTALDVTVQAQILALLDEMKRETGTAVILVTHDLGVVADHADDVAVMYAGRIAEQAPAAALFARPEHPYTAGLLGAAPGEGEPGERLASIEGTVPDLRAPPPGCRFAPRCPFAVARCDSVPPLVEVAPGHATACWRAPLDQVLEAA
ncbi:ABC transporter ATP-binding protein [Roseomonas alkaliterrae]|uniref:Peptide/nickel transport system ATP-binding protein n=1 Tax=Neoroseomonas alkaliterrae TaxID=1452450 RepID=A0A840Y419_9PROT|nr:ABC transporter ATP-binding protein [Neoroseomonas alkaliterrae]MBB5691117.1 peptide/nickel transport system ATP-binding protein [Neoroseomonas alkaliterrae]MBR0676083.1 ABC transporter ATP-binding protein [Neoroseomonas alkaliterrae]